MSSLSWQEKLQARRKADPALRVAILGVGQELHGDDAAGVLLVRGLSKGCIQRDEVLILDAGTAPESLSGRLRRFAPGLVILIDAADMGLEAGALRWMPCSSLQPNSASTHALSLDLIAAYLASELGCEVVLLGIQAAAMDFGSPLSPPVEAAVASAQAALASILCG